jgi:heme oxygenase
MAVARPHTSDVLARLEHETSDLHAAAEADRFAVLDDATAAGYRRLLATIYHFEYAVEASLVNVSELPVRLLLANLRTGALGADLLALGTDLAVRDTFARDVELPIIAGVGAFGWFYALQRNTLHHAGLHRALAPRLRSVLHVASRYLTFHANDVYERWHQLGAHLDRCAPTPGHVREIVAAARDAFVRQHRWFAATLAR